MKLAMIAAITIVPLVLEAQTGAAVPELAGVESALQSIGQKYQLPGMSSAIAHAGRLVYARGFGFADRDRSLAFQPASLSRVGSISKTFTAITLLKLQEQGKLSLDDKVFDILTQYRDSIGDPRMFAITVRQLLHHTAGWDSETSGDPLFPAYNDLVALGGVFPPAPTDVVSFWLTQPLDFDPGSAYKYSNFGFLLAGQVIEKVTGQTYGHAVRALVLEPLGITHMRLGRTFEAQAAPDEVHYYDNGSQTGLSVFSSEAQTVAAPYGTFSMDLISSAGAWIASAPELVRLLGSLDVLLTPASKQQFLERPAGLDSSLPVWYGLGIQVQEANGIYLVHGGNIPGAFSVFASLPDGTQIAFLTNTNGDTKDPAALAAFQQDLFGALLPALASVQQWPADIDQFPDYVAQAPPSMKIDTVASAASLIAADSVSPGEVLTLSGTGLADTTRVWFDSTPAPLLSATVDLIKVVSPFDLAGKSDVSITVATTAAGNWTAPVTLQIVPTRPAAFLQGDVALASNEDGTLHSTANPAARGSLVTVYATGLGALASAVADGAIADASSPLPLQTPVVSIGGIPAAVEFAGCVPGQVYGVFQIGIRIPRDAATGVLPLVIQSGSAVSPTGAVLAIR